MAASNIIIPTLRFPLNDMPQDPDSMYGADLTRFTRMDQTLEQYYAAGDKFLSKAFDLFTAFGNKFAADDALK